MLSVVIPVPVAGCAPEDDRRKQVLAGEIENEIADEIQQQDQHHRRQIQPAHVRQQTPDGAQRRFGELVKRVYDHIDDTVRCVDHVEVDQPARDHGEKQDPDIKRDNVVDQIQDGGHVEFRVFRGFRGFESVRSGRGSLAMPRFGRKR